MLEDPCDSQGDIEMTSRMQTTRWISLVLALAIAAFAPGVASGQDAGSVSRAVRNTTGIILPGVTADARDPALAVLPLASGAALAQDTAIEGVVIDATGLVLPGVTVDVGNQASGEVTTVFTDGTGRFVLGMLDPGVYEVTFVLPGFSTVVRTVEVSAGAVTMLEVEMEVQFQETVAVVGTRAEPRSVTASPVPVDVITAADFLSQGDIDLTNQLRTVVPSFNVNTQPISDAATIVRPANLRNMAPDHTLVLVNGKRRHRAAVIAWLGNGIADGAQGPDLSVIPSIALRQVEVLRDGAAAQYGSDAIAGVLNFELKNNRSGGAFEFRTGRFQTENAGDPSTCGPGRSCNGIGGNAPGYTFAGNVGLPLGPEGFLNLSLEYGGTSPTNRAVQDNGALAVINGGNMHVRDTVRVWGSPQIDDDLKLFGNFGTELGDNVEFYGHTNYASKKVTGGFYFRNPNNRGNVYSIDGGDSLLVGDVLAATGMGSANCPTVAITDGTPDPAAFAQVQGNSNCFTFHQPFLGASGGFPGGFTPQFGGDVRDLSLVSGVRGTTGAVSTGTSAATSGRARWTPSSSTRSTRRSARTARPASIRTCCSRPKRASTSTSPTPPAT